MVLKFSFHFPFPISLPPPPTTPQHIHNHPTELQFSRWYNANADEHNERRQAQQDIEHDIRLQRRYKAATKITTVTNPTTPTNTNHTFKSIGTPSAPSRASIPGKHSKYSKPETRPHPAFRRIPNKAVTDEESGLGDSARVKLGEDGISYVIDGAPFEFKYSYTETPKVKPVKLREPGFAPFGPGTMPRPWTGRAPLPASKKKLKEFDSFEPPAPGTKGVKPVQAPGPFLPGSGPRYVRSREEVLGEALTGEEIKELVKSCIKSRRQLNIGRDGLTHNMLDNIHAHWKRRRVCKIKCKGVCTVDMDNVCQQLEERTGGKIIYRKDGVVYLFRGRNYNYRTRPRFPLMLWKPVTPVYPKLIKRVPECLTLDEATEMRKKGKNLLPICKLAKNGVYCNLVKDVKEAFEECELVRIDCQGLNPSDYKKIGAKLKDLVPCVLLSFENEQILMWRGKEWKSSYPEPEADNEEVKSEIDSATLLEDKGASAPRTQMISHDAPSETLSKSFSSRLNGDLGTDGTVDPVTSVEINEPTARTGVIYPLIETCENNITLDKDSGILNDYFGFKAISHDASSNVNNAEDISHVNGVESILETASHCDGATIGGSMGSDDASNSEIIDTHPNMSIGKSMVDDKLQSCSGTLLDQSDSASSIPHCTNGILHLLKQAVEDGSAVILDCKSLDADIVYEKAVDLSLNAPPGPVFRHRPKKVQVERSEREITDSKEEEVKVVSEKKAIQNKNRKTKRTSDHDERLLDVEPQGSLRVDELAKLLA